jgi:uracil-DNA glycosylase
MDKAVLQLQAEISRCQICLPHLEFGVNPVVSFSEKSRILVIGQAPGSIVHSTGVPWNDKSGDNLRAWLGVDEETFYNPDNFGIVPMGFCYPGKGKSGDLPPRKECAPEWHTKILSTLTNVDLTLLIGQYAQKYYLGSAKKKTLTETVENYKSYLPQFFVLPHPSPRNNIWMKKNPWFKATILPDLKEAVRKLI